MKRLFLTNLLAIAALAAATAPARCAVEEDNVTVDVQTDAVIHGALAYLARHQGANGAWGQGPGESEPIAMTSYALMAFLSAGNLPDEGEYGHAVSLGTQYLVNQAQPDGLFRDAAAGKYMYNHGIATIALSEIYGQTRSPILRQRLQQMVGVIVSSQSPQLGGWRYKPEPREADISVTVLQVAALRSAMNAGIAVPPNTVERAIAYVDACFNQGDGGFAYQPRGPSGYARTAAAIYSLQVCGKYDDPRIAKGSDYLFAKESTHPEWWDYGSYYAAPAQYMIGGDTWKRWYDLMKQRLFSTETHDGDTIFWKVGGRIGPLYDTAVAVTILAMPYHYIPLYQR